MAYELHGRAEWLRFGASGMSGPSQDRNAVRRIVLHYNGGSANLAGGDDRYANVLADMNDGYWRTRGYALGYNFGLAPDGDLWIIRGTDIRCAANGCQSENIPAVAIQGTTVAVTADPTPQQIDALENRWVPWLRDQYGNDLELHVNGHRDVNPRCSNATGTICPGPKWYPMVQAGRFDQPSVNPPPEEPVTPAEMDQIAAKAAAAVWNTLIDNLADPNAADVPAKLAMAYVLRNTAASFNGTSPAGEVDKATNLFARAAADNSSSAASLAQETLDAVKALPPGGGGPPVNYTITLSGDAEPVTDL